MPAARAVALAVAVPVSTTVLLAGRELWPHSTEVTAALLPDTRAALPQGPQAPPERGVMVSVEETAGTAVPSGSLPETSIVYAAGSTCALSASLRSHVKVARPADFRVPENVRIGVSEHGLSTLAVHDMAVLAWAEMATDERVPWVNDETGSAGADSATREYDAARVRIAGSWACRYFPGQAV